MSSNQESFVNVHFTDTDSKPEQTFNKKWSEKASAKHSSPDEYAAEVLRQAYPKHSLVMSLHGFSVFGLPGTVVTPLEDVPLLTATVFWGLSRMDQPVPGTLLDIVVHGAFSVSWEGYDFLVYIITYPVPFGQDQATFILHEGPEDPARSFILANGIWQNELHNEIWVFNQGFWNKDPELFAEVQKANWDDVILKDDFKKGLQKDVFGFFSSRELYKKLSIPWKRGLIMHGPPGNGKTISLKAIMKTCAAKGWSPLYVKSFKSWRGEEGSMAEVFNKARILAPCVLVLEDLDSLINDGNRSFFLNQLDGLSGNDGLFLIATTNHFDRLDPGLSTRPSRFDRKYLFDDPDLEERTLYAQYWQKKLKDNHDVAFPDSLVTDVAEKSSSFSFAYLKEAFVSSLVILAGAEEKSKPKFADVLLHQIAELRKQLDKFVGTSLPSSSTPEVPHARNPLHFRTLMDSLSSIPRNLTKESNQGKVFTLADPRQFVDMISGGGEGSLRKYGPSSESFRPVVPGAFDDAYMHRLPGFKK